MALALGPRTLVRDRRYDEQFVREHTFGFEAWTGDDGQTHRGFRDLVLSDYPPEKVARITGVPIAVIEQLADEMSRNRPSISFADGGAAAATNGLGTAMAIHALNALLGNLERAGGLLVQRTAPLDPWPPAPLDDTARAGLAKPRIDGAGGPACPLGGSNLFGVPDAILAGRPYPAKALLLYRSNPAFSKPGGRRWIEAMQRVPLVVSFSPLPDESTMWADYVLPDHTYLEAWDVVEPAPSIGYPVLGLRRPVVVPLHDTMATGGSLGSRRRSAAPWPRRFHGGRRPCARPAGRSQR
jgi:anaerobic selenocysteine-containing dehydrogenase